MRKRRHSYRSGGNNQGGECRAVVRTHVITLNEKPLVEVSLDPRTSTQQGLAVQTAMEYGMEPELFSELNLTIAAFGVELAGEDGALLESDPNVLDGGDDGTSGCTLACSRSPVAARRSRSADSVFRADRGHDLSYTNGSCWSAKVFAGKVIWG
jgi:hypothetical protein